MKSSRIIFWIIGAVVLALVFYIANESFTQPGMERFEGKYKELGKYRNENNTGPVVRIFAVKALDPDEKWMREYGDAQPHTKYGKTIVFFFLKTSTRRSSFLQRSHISIKTWNLMSYIPMKKLPWVK